MQKETILTRLHLNEIKLGWST